MADYTSFKMRAEFEADVFKGLKELWKSGIALMDYKITYCRIFNMVIPDVVCVFTTEKPTSIEEVRNALKQVVDGHVMVGSAEAEQFYDGERRDQPLTSMLSQKH